MPSNYQIWVNKDRTILVTLWPTGTMEIAKRESPDHTWGPPERLEEEK